MPAVYVRRTDSRIGSGFTYKRFYTKFTAVDSEVPLDF